MDDDEAVATAKAELIKAGLLNATDADALIAIAVASFNLAPDLTDLEIDNVIATHYGNDAIRAGRVGLAHLRH